MTILHAGEIGRLSLLSALISSDEFAILQDGSLKRITAGTANAFFSALNRVTVTSTSSVSNIVDVLVATIDSTNIDITIPSVATANRALTIIRDNTGAGSGTLTVLRAGSDQIKEPGGTLITSKVIINNGDSFKILPLNSTQWNVI